MVDPRCGNRAGQATPPGYSASAGWSPATGVVVLDRADAARTRWHRSTLRIAEPTCARRVCPRSVGPHRCDTLREGTDSVEQLLALLGRALPIQPLDEGRAGGVEHCV